jgi:hypothetical protein
MGMFNPATIAMAQEIFPVLQFPEQGMDDPSAYQGYKTCFLRDSQGNTVQILVNQNSGRVVNLWADAANESISFTVRDGGGRTPLLAFDFEHARAFSEGTKRYIEYRLLAPAAPLHIGLVLSGSMRKERDFQYQSRHLGKLGIESGYIENEFPETLANIAKLAAPERQRHLALLHASRVEELWLRLKPTVALRSSEDQSTVWIEQATFDGKNSLVLALQVDNIQNKLDIEQEAILVSPVGERPIHLTVRVGTDAPALTPVKPSEIFSSSFAQFYEAKKRAAKSDVERISCQWMERHMHGMELLASQEKIMAGLPNFATYFGRDTIMSALMLEDVWSPDMQEYVIAGILRRLSPRGEVSHEESLGGQAIRENLRQYNRLITDYWAQQDAGNTRAAASSLAPAEDLLGKLQETREDYRMLDDDFQFPVLMARYLVRPDISVERKRAFLLAKGGHDSRLARLLNNLLYIAQRTHPYVKHPAAKNLIRFPPLSDGRFFPGSWRDSGAGYGNGCFAMDVNVVWTVQALKSLAKIVAALHDCRFGLQELEEALPEIRGSVLHVYAENPQALQLTIQTWQGAVKHFAVRMNAQELEQRLRAKLDWLTPQERAYWQQNVIIPQREIAFLALSLDAEGQPIPMPNTDIGSWLFLEDLTSQILQGKIESEEVMENIRILVLPYPVGLFLRGLGPLVVNDAYASSAIWEKYRRDHYHSPRVVWGREVNLILLGLRRQMRAAMDDKGCIKDSRLVPYVRELEAMLATIRTAVDASGLKHNELWSYQIVGDKLLPVRYASSCDIQLWNLTDLAVQFSAVRD